MPLVFSNSAITLCKSKSSITDRHAASSQLPAWYTALMKSNLPHWFLAIPASMSMTFCEYPVLFIICDKALAELNGSCRMILHGRINLHNTRSTMYRDVYCFQIMWTSMQGNKILVQRLFEKLCYKQQQLLTHAAASWPFKSSVHYLLFSFYLV